VEVRKRFPWFCRLIRSSSNHWSTHGSKCKNRFGVESPTVTKTGEGACRNRKVPDANWGCGYSGMVRVICGAANSVCAEFKTEPDSLCRCDVSVRGRLDHRQRNQKQPAIGCNSAIGYSRRLAWSREYLDLGSNDAQERTGRTAARQESCQGGESMIGIEQLRFGLASYITGSVSSVL
jgi:hypothetical protein